MVVRSSSPFPIPSPPPPDKAVIAFLPYLSRSMLSPITESLLLLLLFWLKVLTSSVYAASKANCFHSLPCEPNGLSFQAFFRFISYSQVSNFFFLTKNIILFFVFTLFGCYLFEFAVDFVNRIDRWSRDNYMIAIITFKSKLRVNI